MCTIVYICVHMCTYNMCTYNMCTYNMCTYVYGLHMINDQNRKQYVCTHGWHVQYQHIWFVWQICYICISHSTNYKDRNISKNWISHYEKSGDSTDNSSFWTAAAHSLCFIMSDSGTDCDCVVMGQYSTYVWYCVRKIDSRHAVVWCYRCPDLRYFIPVSGKNHEAASQP